VQAKGAGFAILQMSVQYNVDMEKYQTEPPIKAFDLHTKAIFHGRNQSHINYLSCARYENIFKHFSAVFTGFEFNHINNALTHKVIH
jgi:hypothetical protein